MDLVLKSRITYDEVKTIFDDKIITSANNFVSEKPTNNRTKLLKYFLI